MKQVQRIAVLGAGDMGHGVAELAALRGFDVRLRDISQEVLGKAMQKVRWSLDKLAQHQTITKEAADAAFARLHATTDLREAVAEADMVIEAVPERLDLKRTVFAEVEDAAPADCVLASNTSALRIREIAEGLKDKSRLVGMHFFNPVLLMDLVEIIPSPESSPDAVAAVEDVSKRMGKTTVTLEKDTPGFVTSRLIGTWVGAAMLCHDHKLGTKEEIDAAMKFGAGFPMGPFELADYTGVDIGYHASEYLRSTLGEAYKPSQALAALVQKGELGKKSGKGFYAWENNRMTTKLTPDMGKAFDPALVLSVVANEAAKLLEQGVASAADIDLAMRNGCAFPKGPLEWADAAGLDVVVKTLYTLEEKTGEAIVKPYELLVEKVEAGQLGRKTGEGFHKHEAAAPQSTGATGAGSGAGGAAELETVLVEVDKERRIGILTLNRPHRLHALNAQLFSDLQTALARMDADADVRVVLLTASGDKAFCAGADLAEGGIEGPHQAAQLAREGHLMCLRMEKMGKPVVAAINGVALGGGLELALPADFRVAAKRAKFALPEVTLGLLPAMGGTQRLPKLIGLAAAKEIALLGERFDADTALRLGLVHRVYENDTFLDEAKEFAAKLAERAPLALRFTKQLLNMAPTTDLLAGMEAEAAAFGVLTSTEDMLEGVSSMFAKRKPEFSGK